MKKIKNLLLTLLLLPALSFGQATGKVISNKASGGSIGSAATTVDAVALFNVNQTTAGQTLTVPNLTNASAGKTIYISNVGSTSFFLTPGGYIPPTYGVVLRWDGTQWSVCGSGLGNNNLDQTLLNGNKTGEKTIRSDNSNTILSVLNNGFTVESVEDIGLYGESDVYIETIGGKVSLSPSTDFIVNAGDDVTIDAADIITIESTGGALNLNGETNVLITSATADVNAIGEDINVNASDNLALIGNNVTVQGDSIFINSDSIIFNHGTPNKYLYLNSNKTASYVDLPPSSNDSTLAQILANVGGNKVNGLRITSNSGLSFMDLTSGNFELNDLAQSHVYFYMPANGRSFSIEVDSKVNSHIGAIAIDTTGSEYKDTKLVSFNTPNIEVQQGTASKFVKLDASKKFSYVDAVTSVGTGYGLTGGTITTTGTVVADTSAGKLATQNYVNTHSGTTYTATKPISISGGNVISMPKASATDSGYVSTNAQTFAGVKTFNSTISGSINGNAATVTTNANLTGDVTSSGNATTLATVNSNVGSFGSATQVGTFTVNGKGLTTAASNVTITPAIGSITGLGTGVSTALGTNVGSAGSFVVNGGALGTPSGGTGTNLTGIPISTGFTGGATNRIPYFTSSTAQTTASTFLFDGTNLGIGATPQSILTVARQTSIATPISGTTAQFVGLDANPLRLTFDTHNNASGSGTALMGRRSRGTAASPSALSADDVLFSINGRGYGTTGYAAASTGLLTISANQTFTDANMGTYVSISTTPDNSVTAAEVARFKGSGALNLTTGGTFQINNTDVLSASTLGSGVTSSSLTSFGTSSTVRTNIGATTVGSNFFTLTNPSAITFPRINADNTVTARSAANFLSDIGGESALTFSTGLTRSTNTITSNLSVGVSGGQTAIGGTGVTDALTFKSTTGNATTTATAFSFTGGNNGATTIASMLNNGTTSIGPASTTGLFNITTAGGVGTIGSYIQNTNSVWQAQLYLENNRGSLASYGGFSYGGSANISANLFGLSRADKLFLFADGASNLGLGIGTLVSQPLTLGTNNAARVTILGAGNVGVGATSPTSSFTVSGSLGLSYVAKTANYTLTASDYVVDCTSNSFTITLPTAVGITGRVYIIKNTGTATTITIATTSSQTIDGAAPSTIVGLVPVTVMSNGANWITL